MSGYREHSFDPNAGGDYGPPLRPFNWVQWSGVACLAIAIAIILAYFAGRLGIVPELFDSITPATAFALLSIPLTNSRRQPGGFTSESKRKRMVVLAVGLMVFAAAIITILVVKGA